ncbi:MAG: heavy metal-associated domain-containing protein [Saprospiraceae bacterium]
MSVHGMTCSACQARVKRTIKSLDGVVDAEVSLENKMAVVTYDSLIIKPEQIQKAVIKDGYQAGNPEVDKG